MSAAQESLRVGIRIPPCTRADRIVDTVRRAEALGFDEAWFPDSQLLWRDVFTTLTAAALGTERIGLGTAVTNLVTRHPAVVASAARSVAELAPGRFTLGLGVGNSSVGPVGLRQSTTAAMREGLALLRGLLDGEERDFEGPAGTVRSRLRAPAPGYRSTWRRAGRGTCDWPGRSPTVRSCSAVSLRTLWRAPPHAFGRARRRRGAPWRRCR